MHRSYYVLLIISFVTLLSHTNSVRSADWQPLGNPINAQGDGELFGSVLALSFDGSQLVAGAPLADGVSGLLTDDRGAARVYQFEGGAWAQVGADINGMASGDEFGKGVAISSSGQRIAIGAPNNHGSSGSIDDYRGHVRVFEFISGAWTQVGQTIEGEAEHDRLGRAIALSTDGSILAVGSLGNDNGQASGNNYGKVWVYQLTGGVWQIIGQPIVGGIYDQLGVSVSLSDDGTYLAAAAVGLSGYVRVYHWTGSDWDAVSGEIHNGIPDYTDPPVTVVSLSSDGKSLAVGSRFYDENILEVTALGRAYKNTGPNTWEQVGQVLFGSVPEANNGIQLSLSGDGQRLAFALSQSSGRKFRTLSLEEGSWSTDNVFEFPVDGATAATISKDGTTVAAGYPYLDSCCDSLTSDGMIQASRVASSLTAAQIMVILQLLKTDE